MDLRSLEREVSPLRREIGRRHAAGMCSGGKTLEEPRTKVGTIRSTTHSEHTLGGRECTEAQRKIIEAQGRGIKFNWETIKGMEWMLGNRDRIIERGNKKNRIIQLKTIGWRVYLLLVALEATPRRRDKRLSA